MATPSCFGSRQIVRFRVAKLDTAGAPDDGASNGFCTDNPISVQVTPVIEAGDNITVKNGAGAVCQSFITCDKQKGTDLVVSLCELDPQLISLMTGGTLIDDSNGAMGAAMPLSTDDCALPVSVEWWTIAQDGTSQAVVGGSAQYWHFVVPKATFVFGAQTFENGILTVVLNGKGEENANITANGPFNDWPATIADDIPDGAVSSFTWWREAAASLPSASCAFVTVSSLAS